MHANYLTTASFIKNASSTTVHIALAGLPQRELDRIQSVLNSVNAAA